MDIDLESLDPAIVRWLRNESWMEGAESYVIDLGKRCFEEGRVEKNTLRGWPSQSGGYGFSGKVTGAESYETDLEIVTGEGDFSWTAYCSCPVEHNCKHAVALLHAIAGAVDMGRDKSGAEFASKRSVVDLNLTVNRWIENLSRRTVPRSRGPDFSARLVFTVSGAARRLVLSAVKTMAPISGRRVRRTSPIEGNLSLDWPPFFDREDRVLCAQLGFRQKSEHCWTWVLAGTDWSEWLEKAVEYEKLYLCAGDFFGMVRQGPAIEAEPGWEALAGGGVRPGLGLASHFWLLATDPVHYLDVRHLLLGRIETRTPGEQILRWISGPDLGEHEIASVEKLMKETAPELPGPPEVEIVERDVDPEFRLRLFRNDDDGPMARVVVAYGGNEFPLRKGRGDHFSAEGHCRIRWRRRVRTENARHRDLSEAGLEPGPSAFDWGAIGSPERQSQTWATLRNSVEMLSKSGWSVDIDKGFGYRTMCPDAESVSMCLESGQGIDWFRFAVTCTIDGEEVDLLPVLVELVRLGVLEDPDFAAMDDDDMYLAVTSSTPGPVALSVGSLRRIIKNLERLGGVSSCSQDHILHRLEAAQLAAGNEELQVPVELGELARRLAKVDSIPAVSPPRALKARLRPYQREGLAWLQFLARHGLHGVLADDMGLGKTLQAIAHIARERADEQHDGKPCLVVAPTSVVPNWMVEIRKFLPSASSLRLQGLRRCDYFPVIDSADIVVTSYPLLLHDIEELKQHVFHLVILDESQIIKNPSTRIARAARALQGTHRLCLSGTPMENHLGELWSTMQFLMPGFLGKQDVFNRRFRIPIERDNDEEKREMLNRRLAPVILRRRKDDVVRDLPSKTHIMHSVELTRSQQDLYESIRAVMDVRMREAIAERGIESSQIYFLSALLKLRQVCCHPALIKDDHGVDESAKYRLLLDLIPALVREGRRVLIFSQFTSMLDIIEDGLDGLGLDLFKLTGRTRNRTKVVEGFQNDEAPVFLISLKAGGTGLNLTRADTVVHYDPWWNPAAENQATDRAHRIGQEKPVFVHRLICRGTIEERIQELQQKKSALVEALLTRSLGSRALTREMIEDLLHPISDS